jgi:hypothetical protein
MAIRGLKTPGLYGDMRAHWERVKFRLALSADDPASLALFFRAAVFEVSLTSSTKTEHPNPVF